MEAKKQIRLINCSFGRNKTVVYTAGERGGILRNIICFVVMLVVVSCISTDAAFETSSVPIRNQALAYSASELFSGETKQVPTSYISASRMYLLALEIERVNISARYCTDSFSIGLLGDYFGTKDIAPNIDYAEYIKALNAIYQLKSMVKFGIQLNNYQLASVYTGSGFSIDVGLQTRVLPKLNLTVELKDLSNKFYYSTGKVEKKPLQTVFFAEYDFKINNTIYLAVSDGTIAIGNEFCPVTGFAVRLGINDGYWSGGVGIDNNQWRFEYALYSSLLGNQQSMSIQRRF